MSATTTTTTTINTSIVSVATTTSRPSETVDTKMADATAPKSCQNLFEVYLRLRPPPSAAAAAAAAMQMGRVLTVEAPAAGEGAKPSRITLNPPSDRRRAIERFGFTQVFEESATQLDVFSGTEITSLVESVLAPSGGEGTDAVVATLGVTGSGKTHTILGSKSHRGLTQLAMDVVFRSIGPNMLDADSLPAVLDSLQACDPSESSLIPAAQFLETVFSDPSQLSRAHSRAATPMTVRNHPALLLPSSDAAEVKLPVSHMFPFKTNRSTMQSDYGGSFMSATGSRRNLPPLPSTLPKHPDVSAVLVPCDTMAEYVVVVSMYEVHNDRIYDLLTPATRNAATKEFRRRPLLFKPTEASADRKVVAGLRKVVCTTIQDGLYTLEAGLQERRVTGTGSNSVSSRSHGFFCFEVQKRHAGRRSGIWSSSKLTIVDLAGSERAREAKTAGATLAEAGKINESLMYLGQCLQTQSESNTGAKPNVVPYRQCKLTELLFSNSFPLNANQSMPRRKQQKGVMIVTADATGDFNATSQILRYSALAREVTVPRVPSITATILAGGSAYAPTSYNDTSRSLSPVQHPPMRPVVPAKGGSSSSSNNNNNNNNNIHRNQISANDERATMEIAALEIARLSDEIDQLRAEAEAHMEARFTAEAHILSMEDRLLDLEAAIRDECAAEFEQTLMLELARFKASLALEQERGEEHWDRKVDLLERGLEAGRRGGCGGALMTEEDDGNNNSNDKENVLVEDLEQEVERLRRENGVLKRELAARSPTKRRPLEERKDFSCGIGSLDEGMAAARAARSSPGGGADSTGTGAGGLVTKLGHKFERMRVAAAANDMESRSAAATTATTSTSPKKMVRMAKT